MAGCSAEKMRERSLMARWMVLCVMVGFIFGSSQNITELVEHKAQLELPRQSSTYTVLKSDLSDEPMSMMSTTNDEEQPFKRLSTKMLVKSALLNDMNMTSIEKNHSSWCPSAVCHNSDLCYPCQRRFLLVFATGRSASTTLTHMLDLLPGVRMSGENHGTLLQIQQMVNGVRNNPHFKTGARNKKMAWSHNNVPNGAFSCVGQHMIETINPPVTRADGSLLAEEDDSETIVGFKTIRIFRDDLGPYMSPSESDKNLVAFVKETFPCARIVVNIRGNVTEQASSHLKVFGQKDENYSNESQLAAMNERMLNLLNLFGGDYARLLDSSKWTNDVEEINKVLEWLGFSEPCFFKKLLEFNTGGSAGGYINGQTRMKLSPDCKYLG